MGKYILVAQSRAKEGQENEYNEWYDKTHLGDVCALPGVKSGRRFEATPVVMGQPGLPYLAIFEFEADDPGAFMANLGRQAADGTMKMTDALDAESAMLWVYKLRDTNT